MLRFLLGTRAMKKLNIYAPSFQKWISMSIASRKLKTACRLRPNNECLEKYNET